MKKFLLLVTCLFLFLGHVKAEGIVQQYESTYTEQLKIKSSYTPTTADFKRSLEKFCNLYYSDCFSGRTYVSNSLTVSSVSYPDSESIRIDGRHSYRGQFGVLYSDKKYYAIIRPHPRGFEITFYKRSSPDLWHDDYYWESRTKVIDVD